MPDEDTYSYLTHIDSYLITCKLSCKLPKELSPQSSSLSTQPTRDVLGTSPEGPNVRDLQGTFRGLLGNQQKK